MAKVDNRWKQRFSNFKKALEKLHDAIEQDDGKMTDLEKEGMVQRFEYCFELAWKTLQDLLYDRGYLDIKGPTLVLRQSLRDGYIKSEGKWRRMKKARELTSHTYDEATANEIVSKIKDEFYDILFELKVRLDLEFSK